MSRTVKKPYRKSRRFDKSCRCHGGCPACLSNRMIGVQKAKIDAKQQLTERLDA